MTKGSPTGLQNKARETLAVLVGVRDRQAVSDSRQEITSNVNAQESQRDKASSSRSGLRPDSDEPAGRKASAARWI